MLLKEKIELKEDSNISKLLECSEFLSNRIFYHISKMNLIQEIPYKNLEVNILLDCARSISYYEKLYVILQICALSTVFYSLEIPYLISIVGDSGFKIVLKELDEDHSILNLQKALDCIFINRFNTNIASCIKTATAKFKSLDINNAHRVFYMFTNGLDEELSLYDQWKERIFNEKNNSFAFIFSKPKTIRNEQSEFLTQFWNKFSKYCKDNKLPVELIEMHKEKLFIQNGNNFEINEDNVMAYIKSIINVLQRVKKIDSNEKIEKPIFEIKELNNTPSSKIITNLESMLRDNHLKKIKDEPYIKNIKLLNFEKNAHKLDKNESEGLSKNIGTMLKVQIPLNDEVKEKIKSFIKFFKNDKEKVQNLNQNLIDQIKNLRIIKELENRSGVSVVIDSSTSCFGPLSNQHTWSTIQALFNTLGAIDIPCFDLIISGNPNPYVICSKKNSIDILSGNSSIWPIIFHLLNQHSHNTDLASAIRAAYNLHNLKKNTMNSHFLFVITDGIFSLSEIQRINKNVVYCMDNGMIVFGIGVGISPFGIEKLFPNIVYSLNPDKLLKGISLCLSGESSNSKIKMTFSNLKMKFSLEDFQKNPIYKQLKKELMNIPVELGGYDYYQIEMPLYTERKELIGNGKFSVRNYGMYEKNFFNGQKLLIVMLYSCEINEDEDQRLSYKYIMESKYNTESIQSSLDYTGIKVEVVINYKDAKEN